MSSFNKVILMGNLTRDPEVKHTQSNNCVLSFSIGINKKYRDRQGQTQEISYFPRCVAWNKTAEFIERYFSKGDPIHIEGELQTHSYKDKDEKNVYVTEVFVQHATFAGSTKRSPEQGSHGNQHGHQPVDNHGDEYGYPGDDHPGWADTPF